MATKSDRAWSADSLTDSVSSVSRRESARFHINR
jgi:hypothetical protein